MEKGVSSDSSHRARNAEETFGVSGFSDVHMTKNLTFDGKTGAEFSVTMLAYEACFESGRIAH